MKPVKLKSGNWNVRVYLGKDKDGKSIVRSVTAKTRSEAMSLAQKERNKVDGGKSMTVADAVEAFLDTKKEVLSPNTYRAYRTMQKNNFEGIGWIPLEVLNDNLAQRWVSALVRQGLAPKTVRNNYGLLSAAVNMFAPKKDLNVKLPQARQAKLHTPSTAEISLILQMAKDSNHELYKAVLLGAVGMMRRGEIVALTAADLDFTRNTITINKALALTTDNEYVVKPPKNDSSNRTIIMPKWVMDELPKEGKVVDMNPNSLTMAFRKLVKKAGVEWFRFHDLRHYAASIAASSSIGASVESIKARGGWATDGMMKRVYIDKIGEEVDKDTQAINNYYEQFRFNSV